MPKLQIKNRRKYISYSQLVLFQKDVDEYIRRYLYGEEGYTSEAMDFGNEIHADIQNDTAKVKNIELIKLFIPDHQKHEYELSATIEGVPMFGRVDLYTETKNKIVIADIKTGAKWTQRRADNLDQFKFYDLMVMSKKKKIENELYNIRVQDLRITGEFNLFKVEIKKADLYRFFAEVKKTWKEINKLWDEAIKNN